MPDNQNYNNEMAAGGIAAILAFWGWIVKKLGGKVAIELFREFEKRYDDNQAHNEEHLNRIERKVDKICKL